MISFLLGMAAGAVLIVCVALISVEAEDRKKRKARERAVIHERINTVHTRLDQMGNRLTGAENAVEILTRQAAGQLEFVNACMDVHEQAYHAPEPEKKSPQGDKKK